jgi:hypothetical protein
MSLFAANLGGDSFKIASATIEKCIARTLATGEAYSRCEACSHFDQMGFRPGGWFW